LAINRSLTRNLFQLQYYSAFSHTQNTNNQVVIFSQNPITTGNEVLKKINKPRFKALRVVPRPVYLLFQWVCDAERRVERKTMPLKIQVPPIDAELPIKAGQHILSLAHPAKTEV